MIDPKYALECGASPKRARDATRTHPGRQRLVRGQAPSVLTGAWKLGEEEPAKRFGDAYDDHRDRVEIARGN